MNGNEKNNRLVEVRVDNSEWSLNILYSNLKITSPSGVTIKLYKKTLLLKPEYKFLIEFLSNFNKNLTLSVDILINLKKFQDVDTF